MSSRYWMQDTNGVDPQTTISDAGTLRMTIAILTYRRPNDIRVGLPAVVQQVEEVNRDYSNALSADVVVIDNDAAGSGGQAVAEVGSGLVRYVVEPRPGISAGRNRALDEAAESDLLVFIDDDERPQPGWLSNLVDIYFASLPAAVYGRVVAAFEGDLDPWIHSGAFFERFNMPTGTEMSVAAAGNLLLDLRQVRACKVRFSDRFGLSGGEDTLFCRLLSNRGGRIVWCQESVVTDRVPPERMTRRWVLTRSWSHGNSHGLVDIALAATWQGRAAARVRLFAAGLARVGGGIGRLGVGVIVRSQVHQARGMRTSFRGAGMIWSGLGLMYQEYSRASRTRLLWDRLCRRRNG